MYEDNEGAKALAENPHGYYRSNHIDVRFYFLRGLERLGQVTIHSVAPAEKCADILKKALVREALQRHRDFFMNYRLGVCFLGVSV